MTISQRAEVHGVECDVVCTGRFYDFLERRDGRWGIVLRQPIYEKDRLDPVDPAAHAGARPRSCSSSFPVGYRHLAYVQTAIGYDVKRDMPGLTGPEVEDLYAPRRRVARSRPAGVPPRRSATPAAAGAPRPARIRSAARSAIMITGALVLPRVISGITEASTTRSPSNP